ncbi:MAG: MCE family protein [Jatrophihabitans sp.]|uniref:MCE family protein n=1 Tax=Jatrophihabitans sp. TaxID=1932789 RepID=UPI003F816470
MANPVPPQDAAPQGGAGDGVNSTPLTTRKAPKIGKSFSSRNPTPIGAIGLVLLLALLWAAFNAESLPLIGGGTTYHAQFHESANLRINDDVRIAGVKVGKVTGVSLHDDMVTVDFTVKNAFIGDQSAATIKIKTLLGSKLLDIDSVGSKALPAGGTIPLSRNMSPFDVYPAFTALTNTVDSIDTNKLQAAFQTLTSDFKDTPTEVKGLVTGLSRLSTTIASRDQALQTLLQHAKNVTGVLAARDQDLRALLTDGGLLLDELNARRDAIHSLLVNTQALSTQLSGFVHDNEKTIGPLLDELNNLTSFLLKNQETLDRGLSLLGPFYRVFNNVIGNGRWFDNYITNLSVPGLLKNLTGI